MRGWILDAQLPDALQIGAPTGTDASCRSRARSRASSPCSSFAQMLHWLISPDPRHRTPVQNDTQAVAVTSAPSNCSYSV